MSNPTKDISGASGYFADDNSSVVPDNTSSDYDSLCNGIFYRWTCPVTGIYEVRTDSYSTASPPDIGDTVLYVLPNNTTVTPHTDSLAFNDDDHGPRNYSGSAYYSKVTFSAEAGITYYFFVRGYNTSTVGTYYISWGTPNAPSLPPPARDTAIVTLHYDGGNPGGVVTAVIDNASIGRTYELDALARIRGSSNGTATSSILTLTATDIGGNPGESFWALVYNSDTGEPVGSAIFNIGEESNGVPFPTDHITVEWNGIDTLTINYDSSIATDINNIWAGGNWSSGDETDELGTITITNPLQYAPAGDIYDIEVPGADNSWYHDIASFWIYPGDNTVYFNGGTFGGTLTAFFSGSPTSGITPLSVSFTDHSQPGPGGAITNWSWDFGDGNTSNQQNPSHTYDAPGTYTVSLTVTSPDGTNTLTRTDLITVYAPSTNIDCAHAIPLDPNGGTMIINNQFAPNTPAADDPFGNPYPDGPEYTGYDYDTQTYYRWQFSRQIWYKVTNTSAEKMFLRFVFGPFTGIAAAALYFGPCNNLKIAADTVYTNHLVPEFNISDPDDPNSHSFFPPGGYCGNGSFWNTYGNLHFGTNPGYTLGVVVDPGQTVYLEIAGDDVSTWGAYPTAPGHGWNGDMSLTWDFHAVTYFDGIDSVLQPGNANVTPGVDGLSETIPPHTPLDYSGFDLTQYTDAPPAECFPISYGYHNGHHFIAAVVETEVSDSNYKGEGGAGWGRDQLGIWEFDTDGNPVGFWVIFVGDHTSGLSLINSPAGEGVNDQGTGSRFCSDGTNLWFVTPLYEVVLNPYGGLYDERAGWWYTWGPTHAAVFSFTGSDWNKIGALEAATSNTLFFGNLVGGYGMNGYIFDACASPDELGVLHVISSEWGTQDGPGGVYTGLFTCGHSGTSPRQIRWQTSYAKFSTSGKITQTALDEFNAAAGTEADNSIGSHSSNPPFCWVRSNGGIPIFARIKGIDQFDTPTYTDTFEVYDVSSGAAVLLQTIHAADLSAALPSWWAISSLPTPDQITQGAWSDNSQIDIGNDNQRVWLIDLTLRNSSYTQYWAYAGILLRIPIADPSTYDWFESDPAKAAFNLRPNRFSFYCEPKQTWVLPNGLDISQYIRCINSWYPYPGWKNNRPSYGSTFFNYSGGQWYPSLSSQVSGVEMIDGYFYYAPIYTDDGLPVGYQQFNFAGAFAKSHILRDWYICNIDQTIAQLGQPSIFWYFKDGTWHNAGVGNDPVYNLWVYHNGTWQQHLAGENDLWLYGQFQGEWQN